MLGIYDISIQTAGNEFSYCKVSDFHSFRIDVCHLVSLSLEYYFTIIQILVEFNINL